MPEKRFRLYAFICLSGLISSHHVNGQISATNTSQVFTLYYDEDSAFQDPVFVYHSPLPTGEPIDETIRKGIPGELRARHSDSTMSDFTWQQFNENSNTFEGIKQQNSVEVSRFNLGATYDTKCFRVMVTNTNDSTEIHYAWVFVDHLSVVILGENEGVDHCNEIWFNSQDVQLSSTDFRYYAIHHNHEAKSMANELTYSWESEQRELTYLEDEVFLNMKPLPEDELITLEVSDKFGNSNESSWEIKARVPKADFEAEEKEGYAPFEFNLTDHTENADSMLVLFGDTASPRFKPDTSWYPVKDTTYTYLLPGTYNATLKVKHNQYGCRDSMVIEDIRVNPREIVINNNNYAFNPDISPLDIELKSIKGFHMVIYDRHGRVVQRYQEYNIDEGEKTYEWDGRIRNSNRIAPAGVYYYVIKEANYYTEEGEVRSFFEGFDRDVPDDGTNNNNNNNNNNNGTGGGSGQTTTMQSGIIYIFRGN